MPRYVYHCSKCDQHFQVWHGMKETHELCQLCNSTGYLMKVPQMPSVKIDKTSNNSVGTLTKDYIKENQELLDDMKKEARNQIYED